MSSDGNSSSKGEKSDPLAGLNLTHDELQRFEKALRQPEFRKLLVEYAEEISNPESRAQYEADIKRLEEEKGVDVKFIHPKPGFALFGTVDGSTPCFVNICENELVDKPSSTREGRGVRWQIPHAVSRPRDELLSHPEPGGAKSVRKKRRSEKSSEAERGVSSASSASSDSGSEREICRVFDAIFHPNAIRMAESNARFRELVESSALETLEQNFHVSFDRASIVPATERYYGAPTASVLRNKRPDFEHKQAEQAALPSDDPKSQMPYPYANTSSPSSSQSTSASSSSSSSKPAASPTKQVAETAAAAGGQSVSISQPKYKLKYRNELEWQDFALRSEESAPQRPKELVVEVELPGITSAAEMTLDLYERSLELVSNPTAPAAYKLSLKLSYPVDENRAGAKFDKTRHSLTITAPIIPAPAPPHAPSTFLPPPSAVSFASSDSGASEPEASCTHDELEPEHELGLESPAVALPPVAVAIPVAVPVAPPEHSTTAAAAAASARTNFSISEDTALQISSCHVHELEENTSAALPGGAADNCSCSSTAESTSASASASASANIASTGMRSCRLEEENSSSSTGEVTRRKKCSSPVPMRRSRDESDSPQENSQDDSPPRKSLEQRRYSNDSASSDHSSNENDTAGSCGQLSSGGERRHKKSNILDPNQPRRSKHVSFCEGTQDYSAEKSRNADKYRSARATADDFFTFLPGCGVPKNRRKNKGDKKEGGAGAGGGQSAHHRRGGGGARKDGGGSGSSTSSSSDSGSDTLPSPPPTFSEAAASSSGSTGGGSPFATSSSTAQAGASTTDSDDEPPLLELTASSLKPLIEELPVPAQTPVPAPTEHPAPDSGAPTPSSEVQTMLSWKDPSASASTSASPARSSDAAPKSKTATAPLTNSLIFELDE